MPRDRQPPPAPRPPSPAPRRRGRPAVAAPKSAKLVLAARPAWLDWLRRFAEARGATMTATLEEGAKLLAKREGAEGPPPR